MLRETVLGVARNDVVRKLITGTRLTDQLVRRFVAGDHLDDAIQATRRLTGSGLKVSIDHLGEGVTQPEDAERCTHDYLDLLDQLRKQKLAPDAEVSIKTTAIGLQLADHGPEQALENARVICIAARTAGTDVTVDMEEHTTTDDTLALVGELRKDYPDTGVVVQAYLRRTETDCRDLAGPGSRVRLVKGAYSGPESVAYTDRHQIDKAYVRCLKILMNGRGYPMIATHDPRLISIAESLAIRAGRSAGQLEFQFLYGIGVPLQQRLLKAGHTVRVYLPYGTDWYNYLARRLAERPTNLALLARGLARR
jgi:proline dehydrogenase